jgi:putative transposase
MTNGTVRKDYHCAWQIHYHSVFSVKYRKALLDSEVTEIIKQISEGLSERCSILMEAIGCDGHHVATVDERANWDVLESYVQKQGQPRTSLGQLKLFE